MADKNPTSYFDKFVSFTPNPLAPLLKEFNRLARTQKWDSEKYKKEKSKCLLNECDIHIGTTARGSSSEKLCKLQALCIELGIDPVPVSIAACGKALKKTHVNILDLVDARRRRPLSINPILETAFQKLDLNKSGPATAAGRAGQIGVKIFKNVQQLRVYTCQTRRFFPKEQAKKEGALRWLLREIN